MTDASASGADDLITTDLVILDRDLGSDRQGVIRALAERVAASGRASESDTLAADAWAREQKTDTGVPGGIAIPHCRSTSVLRPTLVMARPTPAVDFGASDGPADLLFFIAAPDGADQAHLALLSKLARSLIREDFTAALRSAPTEQAVVDLVLGAVSDEPQAASTTASAPAAATAGSARTPVVVGVTACPTGIAHTYMAADALVNAAKKAGVELHIETQGSSAVKPLDPALIERADAVIFAVDVDVRDKARFAGKPVVQVPVKRGIDEPETLIAQAVAAASDPAAARVPSGGGAAASTSAQQDEHLGQKIKRVLLTGVSYMIPFVAGGGLLIALGFLLAGFGVSLTPEGATQNNGTLVALGNTLWNLPEPGGIQGLGIYLGSVFFVIGAASMGFLVPALAGYVAYGIADRPGIAPGFVAGAVSGLMGAGFLGGLAGGVLAGLAALYIGRIPAPRWLRGLMPVVIIPLLASIIASGLLLLVLGAPIVALTNGLNGFLTGLTGAGAVLLGVILGAMMCVDLGGPVNKVAYSFAVAGLGAGAIDNQVPWQIMAAVMAAGMVPPLAMAFASTVLYRRGFSQVERENGKAAWLLGAAFISEGAIPFAAVDPLRVIGSSIVGGAITGGLIMATGVVSQAPHGGVFVFFAMNGTWPLFILWVVLGAAVSAFILVGLKRIGGTRGGVPEGAVPAPAVQPVTA